MCFVAFDLVLSFSLSSPILLCFMCLMRFKVVSKPLATKFKDIHFVLKCLCVICASTILLPSVLTCATYFLNRAVPFSLCLPFIDPSNSLIIFKCLVSVTTFVQLFSALFIAYFYHKLVKELNKGIEKLKQSGAKEKDSGMFTQLVIVTLSNIVCWFPAGAIYIVSIFLSRYPVDMVIWTTVTVMPVNSILNPIVFAITTSRKLFKSHSKNPQHKPPVSSPIA